MVEFASGQEKCLDVNEKQIDKFFTLKYDAKLCAPGCCSTYLGKNFVIFPCLMILIIKGCVCECVLPCV